MVIQLNGLQEKIFLDRYALKDPNGRNANIGDTVIVLLDEGTKAHNQQKAVGKVAYLYEDDVAVILRDGSAKHVPYENVQIALETTPEQMFDRVSKAIASVEQTPEKREEWTKKFRDALDDWKLIPGGRIAAGAGASDELTLYNCYVIPSPHDSRGGIMKTLTQMTEIMSRGGGVGINLSSLRPKNAPVIAVNGASSGSVSWGGIYSYATGLIQQGGSRRGALMLTLADWHPDVFEFITVKQQAGKIENANMSVLISNAFMRAVKEDGDWTLKFPDTTHEAYDTEWDGDLAKWEACGYPVIEYKTVKAREIWSLIIEGAWKSAEPGVIFHEYYNDISNSWYFNPIICTNPCAEQGLPSWGVCTLTNVNLSKFEKNGDVDWDALANIVHIGVRFLDNVIDATPYHFAENEANQKNERRIGLGTMGLAELMIKLGIRYGSPESLEFIDKLYKFIAVEAYKASIDLAEEKGAFPAFDFGHYVYNSDAATPTFAGIVYEELCADSPEYTHKMETHGMRNVTVLTQAPTGSTGTMVNTSTGIEPFYAFKFIRESRVGTDVQYVGIAQEWLEAHPGEELPDYFVGAMDLTAEDHVRVQAAIQRWVDSSISKTANAPADFTVEETAKLYELAFELGCKGVTIYRDGSRDTQVLHTEKDEDKPEETPQVKREFNKRPQVLRGQTFKTPTPFGKAYVTINENEAKEIEEVFVKLGKTGADIGVIADGLAIALTLALSPRLSALSPAEKLAWITKKYRRMSGATPIGFGPNKVESLPDAIGKVFEQYADSGAEATVEEYDTTPEPSPVKAVNLDICSACGAAALVKEEGCAHCINCGYSKCS
ncbi:adenosylcobalamin-dependent ribonucleoside-diphosphate reductase [Aneurinibacillus aneurinilyticus]|uniref:adenosylcobalamin-dependent ribonucleoside-diphosphate reductase n=1 Tax=Aneurinibacillus aneurinilyticus TaxID=1391 RepID=UPI003C6C2065